MGKSFNSTLYHQNFRFKKPVFKPRVAKVAVKDEPAPMVETTYVDPRACADCDFVVKDGNPSSGLQSHRMAKHPETAAV